MAISATTQRQLEIALGNKGPAAVICDAIDANTVARGANATLLAAIASVSTTTSNATTTKLHTMVKAIVAAAG